MFFNKINKKNKFFKKSFFKKEKQGFVILIAIVVSGLLVSIGMFIANIAYKELVLSTSTKSSQKAFFVADSVVECALRFDIRGNGFRFNSTDVRTNTELGMECNGKVFEPETTLRNSYTYVTDEGNLTVPDTYSNSDYASSTYYISYANDTDANGIIDNSELVAQKNESYAKLVVFKYKIGSVHDKTIIKVFGHNKYSGTGQVERAIEVSY